MLKNLFYVFMEMFGFEMRRINVGVSVEASKEKRNGLAHLRPVNGGNTFTMPFVVDKPELLNKPSFWLIESMYEQFFKMGYEPVNLEIESDTHRLVYQLGKLKPILVQAL